MRDTRLSAYKRTHVAPRSSYRRIPTFVRTNLAGRAQKLPSARLLSWYDRAKLRSSWRIVVAVFSVARDRFEVLGVRGGDINKSTTFGTEDKCNPFEAVRLHRVSGTSRLYL